MMLYLILVYCIWMPYLILGCSRSSWDTVSGCSISFWDTVSHLRMLYLVLSLSISSNILWFTLIINYSSPLAPHTIITQPTSTTSITPYFCYFVFLFVYLF